MQRGEPPPASRVWYLHFIEGWSYREISGYYGISIPLAYTLAHNEEIERERPPSQRSA